MKSVFIPLQISCSVNDIILKDDDVEELLFYWLLKNYFRFTPKNTPVIPFL